MNGEKNPINITLLLLNVSNLAGSEESGGGGGGVTGVVGAW